MPQAKAPVDLRPLVTTRCPKCDELVEARAGSTERCDCGQMLAMLSATKKRRPPPEPKESASKRRLREEAAKMTAHLWKDRT